MRRVTWDDLAVGDMVIYSPYEGGPAKGPYVVDDPEIGLVRTLGTDEIVHDVRDRGVCLYKLESGEMLRYDSPRSTPEEPGVHRPGDEVVL